MAILRQVLSTYHGASMLKKRIGSQSKLMVIATAAKILVGRPDRARVAPKRINEAATKG